MTASENAFIKQKKKKKLFIRNFNSKMLFLVYERNK